MPLLRPSFRAITAALALAGLVGAANPAAPAKAPAPAASADPIHKIQHVIVIMQENRSFDTYFGTYPGADGLPTQGGQFSTCMPDPRDGGCVKPYRDVRDRNSGGPHNAKAFRDEYNGGRMDGFIAAAQRAGMTCGDADAPGCRNDGHDVMGYHDATDLPNYWAYARDYVLQDRLFEPNASWSLPEHLFLVSEWSAVCAQRGDPMSCENELDRPDYPPDFKAGAPKGHRPGGPDYGWTDLTYLLHKKGVSWAYYVMAGTEPDCAHDETSCAPVRMNAKTPGIWNPLPSFETVQSDGELGNVRDLRQFYDDARNGRLPSVVWIAPSNKYSEHPPALVSAGQSYVTGLVNTIMRSPQWNSTAIFISWDDWGGFYDHVVPPVVDQNGYGFRVPGLVVSPYARRGFIDRQTLSHDAYAKFIEDVFLGGARIDPRTDGRPDRRPDVRENAAQLGDLRADFDFTQHPRPPQILPGGTIWDGTAMEPDR